MDDLAAYRQDHLVNNVARVGPPLIVVVATLFVLAQAVDIIARPATFGLLRLLTLIAGVALIGFAPLLAQQARAGRANAAALTAITFLTLLSTTICFARYQFAMNWMMMLPYVGICTMISSVFWIRKTHLILGLVGSMGIPTTATLLTATTNSEIIIRSEFAAVVVVSSCALYLLMHQVHTRSHRLTLEAEYRAHHDWLTGLTNRQRWMELARWQFETALRRPQPMSLLYVDIDHFKQTNDQFGHEAGDRQLQIVARTLRRVMPNDAIIGRFGGEEFVVLLPHATLPGAHALADRFNQELADHPESISQLTASIGIAEWVVGEPLETLISRADRALLQAKALGRCRTVAAGPIILRPQARPATPEAATSTGVPPAPFLFPVEDTADRSSAL